MSRQLPMRRRPMPDHDAWPAFVVPWDDVRPGPMDLSYLLEKPAGARGFIHNVDGHLATADGQRWRMWGLNLCTDMPFPPMKWAPVVACRLAKYGINCIRLHAIDHRWPNGLLMRVREETAGPRWWGGQDESTRALDPEALARLDFFIACCKAQGIYLDLNLNVARTFTLADGVKDAEQVRWGKGLTYFDPQLITLQQEYAAQLIGHVNPFTGLRYGEEPAIALIELANENSLLDFWSRGLLTPSQGTPARGHWYAIPPSYAADLDQRWNAWLRQRYGSQAVLRDAWGQGLRDDEDPDVGSVRRLRREEFAAANATRFRDEARFYAEIEQAFFWKMKAYLRDTLGANQLILGTSDYRHTWSALPMVAANATLDVMDGHFYWQHPRSHTAGQPWSRDDWWIENTPMVDEPDASVIACCSRSAVAGLPYILSEVNEPFPNDYAAEFIPILAAYALFQDWDGILFYDFDGDWGSLYWEEEHWREGRIASFFELSRDPVKWPQMAGGALMFLRGDVQAARETVKRAAPRDWTLESLRMPHIPGRPYWLPHLPGRLALVHRTILADFDASAPAPGEGERSLPIEHIISDTGELTWVATPSDGHVLIDTPRHQAIIGRAGRRVTSHLVLELATPFAAVQLASLDERPLAETERMLLIAVARSAHTGQRWVDETRQSCQEPGGCWGEAPTRLEPVTGTVCLQGLVGAKRLVVQPLDGYGQPCGKTRTVVDGEPIPLPGKPATPWYLILVKRPGN